MNNRQPSPTTRPKRAYGGLSAAARGEMHRKQLVGAAIDLFGTAGYTTTSIDSICSRARVSTRDFYSYFTNKEDLMLGVYNHIIDTSLSSVTRAITDAERDPVESARAALEAFVNSMVHDERWARINFIEIVGISERTELHRREAINRFARQLQAFASQQAASGTADWIELSELRSIALVGAVHETLTDWILRENPPPLKLVVAELLALFVAAVRR